MTVPPWLTTPLRVSPADAPDRHDARPVGQIRAARGPAHRGQLRIPQRARGIVIPDPCLVERLEQPGRNVVVDTPECRDNLWYTRHEKGPDQAEQALSADEHAAPRLACGQDNEPGVGHRLPRDVAGEQGAFGLALARDQDEPG